MSFFTIDEAIRAAQELRGAFSMESATAMLTEAVKGAPSWKTWDIFLSHASKDSRVVLGVYAFLANAGYSVYVDWLEDKQLDRERVTVETANTLRVRMRQSKSLLFLATESAPKSKWMPWELGYFDGFRPEHVAILPVSSQREAFSGQEYLLLYPWITLDAFGRARVAAAGSSYGVGDFATFVRG